MRSVHELLNIVGVKSRAAADRLNDSHRKLARANQDIQKLQTIVGSLSLKLEQQIEMTSLAEAERDIAQAEIMTLKAKLKENEVKGA